MLNVYAREHGPRKRSLGTILHTVENLQKWWGNKVLSEVTARNCQAYIDARPKVAARRDLETLRAAIGYWHKHYGPLPSVPAVILPEAPAARDRWLAREEAARLLWAARRTPHLARFILIGLYTGSRSGAILAAKWSWVDLEKGIMRRRASGTTESTKRTPPVRLGRRILAHLRRWRRMDEAQAGNAVRSLAVCHYDGKSVTKLRRSWAAAQARAGLPGVTPHTLRHTRATWLMLAGVDPWQASGALGMSLQMLTRTYGHHHPNFQREAAEV